MLIRVPPQATDEQARRRLQRLVVDKGEDYAGLSRLVGRAPSYLSRYVRQGTPKRLPDGERDALARYFGIAAQELGAPLS